MSFLKTVLPILFTSTWGKNTMDVRLIGDHLTNVSRSS